MLSDARAFFIIIHEDCVVSAKQLCDGPQFWGEERPGQGSSFPLCLFLVAVWGETAQSVINMSRYSWERLKGT